MVFWRWKDIPLQANRSRRKGYHRSMVQEDRVSLFWYVHLALTEAMKDSDKQAQGAVVWSQLRKNIDIYIWSERPQKSWQPGKQESISLKDKNWTVRFLVLASEIFFNSCNLSSCNIVQWKIYNNWIACCISGFQKWFSWKRKLFLVSGFQNVSAIDGFSAIFRDLLIKSDQSKMQKEEIKNFVCP